MTFESNLKNDCDNRHREHSVPNTVLYIVYWVNSTIRKRVPYHWIIYNKLNKNVN